MDPGLEIASRVLAALVARGDAGPDFATEPDQRRYAAECAKRAALLTAALLTEFGWMPQLQGDQK